MPSIRARRPRRVVTSILTMAALILGQAAVRTPDPAEATSGGDAYIVPPVIDTDPSPDVVETTLIADEALVDIGNGVMAEAMTFNGTIPGPEFHLKVGDKVIVHFENHLLDESTGIHWHGIEYNNHSDGTPLTQNIVPPFGSYLYKFKVTRPGIFWYHPHHHSSTNQVFKGLYGSIIVTDPNEAQLITDGVLPPASATKTLVLSDTTVCKSPTNDAETYDISAPWVGPAAERQNQPNPKPTTLCDTPIDHDGNSITGPLPAGAIPYIQQDCNCRVNEGQTVLTNGKNVGARGGNPHLAPDPLSPLPDPGPGASLLNIQAGQGLRLQAVNAAATRFFRLRLTDSARNQITLFRVGGEGGILDEAIVEGGTPGGFDTMIASGEMILEPGDRADIVIAVPSTASGVLTLWTEDFPRLGTGIAHQWPDLPTVPVMHLNVTSSGGTYSISSGTDLRNATGSPLVPLGAPTGTLLDPGAFVPSKTGLPGPLDQDIKISSGASFNTFVGTHDAPGEYTAIPHMGSTRYAKSPDTLELTVTNETTAHHPFHLHGFSQQPISYVKTAGGGPDYTFPYTDFVDNIDVPPGYTYKFKVKLDPRNLMDDTTPGGELGRWVFHCHIFFHATRGMVSEFDVVAANGNERPYVDTNDASVAVDEGDTATDTGKWMDPDAGDVVTLAASVGVVTQNGDGTWSWSFDTTDGPTESQKVYITATSGALKDQVAFDLIVGNLPPVVTIDPAQTTSIDEGATLPVLASFTDPGTGDTHTATIDYGTGDGPEPATVGAGTVSGSHQYGDNGVYTVTVTVTDDDGGSGEAFFDVTVGNVDPDAAIDKTATILVNGVPTFILDVGQPQAFMGRATDPGSDDIATSWDWDDGAPAPDETQISLVNPPAADPPDSPTVEPRDVSHDTLHAFSDACQYTVVFAAGDDDAGSDSDTVQVIVQGLPTTSHPDGWWQHQLKGNGNVTFTEEQIDCLLDVVDAVSAVFSETRQAETRAEALDVVNLAGSAGEEIHRLDRELLVAWLNFANGAFEYNGLYDTDGNKVPDTTFADVMSEAESVRNNPASTAAQVRAQRQKLQLLNSKDGG